jgi:hypothetical protein
LDLGRRFEVGPEVEPVKDEFSRAGPQVGIERDFTEGGTNPGIVRRCSHHRERAVGGGSYCGDGVDEEARGASEWSNSRGIHVQSSNPVSLTVCIPKIGQLLGDGKNPLAASERVEERRRLGQGPPVEMVTNVPRCPRGSLTAVSSFSS